MWLLLSGEGAGDIGICTEPVDLCEGADFKVGPMAKIVDRLIEAKLDYSPIDYKVVRYVSEGFLDRSSKQLQPKKSPSLPGRKRKKETQHFERNARVLAVAAKGLAQETDDSVIAVLFRDADRTHSSNRGNWTLTLTKPDPAMLIIIDPPAARVLVRIGGRTDILLVV